MTNDTPKLKICFLWFFDKAEQVYPLWRDGLRRAMEIIAESHEVDWVIGKKYPEDRYDAILFWEDSNSEFFNRIDDYHCKKGLFLTTDPQNFDNLRKLDVVYCESDPVYEAVRRQGIRAIKAFGTDTDFYSPDLKYIHRYDIKYFYPATFSPWKRQADIAYLGSKLLCVGTVQPDGQEELAECLKNGVKVEEGYFPAEKIRDYYRRSWQVIIPAIHGSERTVLEAMSCNIMPNVTRPDNVRTYSYVLEQRASGLTPREFVLKNYSAKQYADQILKGIQ